MAIKYLEKADFNGKRVLARFDFNVPLNKKTGAIADTTRIDQALPTIRYILENGAKKLILMSHLGRPKGGKIEPEFSLEPVATYLAEKLNCDVTLSEKPTDCGIDTLLKLNEPKIVLLENLRFDQREEKDDVEFAKELSSYGDIFVNDAFGALHRKHASVHKIVAFFKNQTFAGFLVKKEIQGLDKIVHTPTKPFVAIIGGAKISDKIKTIEKMLVAVDKLIIGGAMAYPFLKAKGIPVGKSLCNDADVELAKMLLKRDQLQKILLPVDHIVASGLEGKPETTANVNIDDNMMGLDIGPRTIQNFSNEIEKAKTIFWNGPMGLFENKDFSKGTFAVARALANSNGFSFVGGGDSVNAVNQSGVADKISHISTGGGASLEYVENGDLPGVFALKFGVDQ